MRDCTSLVGSGVETGVVIIRTGKRQGIRGKALSLIQLVIEAKTLFRRATIEISVVGADVRVLQTKKIKTRHRRAASWRVRKRIPIVSSIHRDNQSNLLQVRSASDSERLAFRFRQCRQQHRRQNGNNRNDD